jgi:hypothetical protein
MSTKTSVLRHAGLLFLDDHRFASKHFTIELANKKTPNCVWRLAANTIISLLSTLNLSHFSENKFVK